MSTRELARTRDTVDLGGEWDFWPDLADARPGLEPELVPRAQRELLFGASRRIVVPGAWQAQFDDLHLWSGIAWYERTVDVPAGFAGRTVRACFDAVDYHATLWVDGTLVGMHEGGYLPFDFDVTSHVSPGDSVTLTLRVIDPRGAWPEVGGPDDHRGAAEEAFRFAEVPHGKQSWYGPIGGIWQAARLEASTDTFVRGALVHGDVAAGVARITTRLAGAPPAGGERLRHRVTAPDGTSFASDELELRAGERERRDEVAVAAPVLWDVGQPNLYRLDVELLDADGTLLDAWSDTFGFRTVEARDGRIWLNGRPFFMLGALDQDYYPGTICTPPSRELLDAQLQRARELGLNLLRCHIKVPDPRYLDAADRAGMPVWQEVPNWITFTPESRERGVETLRGMIERDFNHPATIAWTIINESWGVDLAGDAEHRAWLAETWHEIKQLDPTRLVVDNSPCEPSRHVVTDVNDYHLYRAIPENHDEWTRWLDRWTASPDWSFSPHGDGQPRGDEPMVLSEFGSWGLPDVDVLLEGGREPWWFATGATWERGIVQPAGVRERFERWQLAEHFGDLRSLTRASQQHEFEQLAFQVQDLRRRPQLAGYVITEFTDAHWEANGLLDMHRNPKWFHDRFRQVNHVDVVIGRPERLRVAAGEANRVDVVVSHFGPRDRLDGSQVHWRVPATGDAGVLDVASLACGEVAEVGQLAIATATEAGEPRNVVVELDWRTTGGDRLNHSTVEFLALPTPRLRPADTDVLLSHGWDATVDSRLAAGGRVVVVLRPDDVLPAQLGLRSAALSRGLDRPGNALDLDWAQGMGFLAPRLAAPLGIGPRVGLAWAGLAPRVQLDGVPAERFGRVLAGGYLGWVHEVAATILPFRLGDGRGIACTFDVLGEHERDPLAGWLVGELLAAVLDDDVQPAVET